MTELFAKSIAGGTVSIEDSVKHKGYDDPNFAPSRKSRVELVFAVPTGADGTAYLNGVSQIALDKLAELLGHKPTSTVQTATVRAADAPKAEEAKPETAAAKKKRLAAEAAAAEAAGGGKTKAQLAAEAGLPTTDTVHKGAAAKTDEELLEDEPTITAAGKAVAEEDDLNDLLGEAAPVPVTDLELANAVQKKNAERKEADPNWAPAKIRDVIAEYSGGKRVNDIPAAKRAEFLKKIEALK